MGFLTGRRITVTGGAGFLGREVCQALQEYGPAPIFVPRSSDFDLRRRDDIRRLFRTAHPEVIVHLAAVVGGIGANRPNPGRYFYDNAIMGIELMEEARLAGVEKFVVTGSISSYPKFTPVPFREDDFWNGYPEETNAPYGLAKNILLVLALAYRRRYGLNAIALLPVNLYGPGDNFDPATSHVIPALIRNAIEARDAGHPWIEAWGSGNATREFLFVRDAAAAIAAATEHYNKAETVNIGSGREMRIRNLAETICRLCSFHGEIRWNPSQPDGQPRRSLDTSRAWREFRFRAQTDFETGLRETIDWYQSQRTHAALAAA